MIHWTNLKFNENLTPRKNTKYIIIQHPLPYNFFCIVSLLTKIIAD